MLHAVIFFFCNWRSSLGRKLDTRRRKFSEKVSAVVLESLQKRKCLQKRDGSEACSASIQYSEYPTPKVD